MTIEGHNGQRIDFKALAAELLDRAPDLLSRWFPGGKRIGCEFCTGNLAGEPGSSLQINLNTGVWCDFATGDKGGDLISLYAAVHKLKPSDAARALMGQCGDNGHETCGTTKSGGKTKPRQKPPYIYSTIYAAIDATARDVGGTYVASWTYHRADGTEAFRVHRFNLTTADPATGKAEKTFRPTHQCGHGHVKGDPPGKLTLYGLPKLLARATERVFVCEGEKAAEAAMSIGLLATTSAHGSKAANKSDWSPLAGRDVVILADNDDAGRDYAQKVAMILTRLSHSDR